MRIKLTGLLSALAICAIAAAPAAAQPTGACVYQDFTFPFTPHCVDGVTETACSQVIGSGGIGQWLGAGTTCAVDVWPEHPYTYDKAPLNIANAGQVNISGASLFVDFFGYPGTTNDCNDVDEDDLPCLPFDPFEDFVSGTCGVFGVDQMAPEFLCNNWNGHWLVQYRSVGSGNGLGEFVDYQLLGKLPSSIPSEKGLINRAIWANTGVKTWPCGVNVEANCFPPVGTGDLNCDNKVDGADVQAMTTAIVGGQAAYLAAYPACFFTRADYNEDTFVDLADIPGLVNCMLLGGCGAASESGTPLCPQSVDVANMDVATKWFVQTGSTSTAGWNQKPTVPGYGYNPSTTVNVGGGTASNQLKNLVRGSLALNTNTADPDVNTVFDTTLAFSPAGLIANRGAGIGGNTGNIEYTELQYLFVTGRMPSGENLTACTRDSGSGTRNLTMNCIGVDPSWGVGDNLGKRVDNDADVQLGAGKQPTNCGGSGVMETAVQNRRLGVGYTGIFGTSRIEGDVPVGKYELLNVLKDIAGAISFVRPDNISKLLDNADANSGYQIGGSQTLATRGDPEAAANGNPPMASVAARDLILNITRSLQTWVSNPENVQYACPAGVLVQYFMPDASVDNLPILTDPTNFQVNPYFNTNAQEAVRLASSYQPGVIGGYGSWQFATGGKVPKRVTGTYEDGSTSNYRDFTGAASISSSSNVFGCMRIQGDWNGDGVRNADDICIMMVAYYLKTTVSSWEFSARMVANDWATTYGALAACCPGLATHPCNGSTSNYIIPELFGDYDGDGNFTAEDIRYFADGLALVSGNLDREAGFTAVDTAWYCLTGNTDDNFFNTVIAIGDMTYNIGDSRFDVAGDTMGPARGAMPRGANGTVDATDVTYVTNNVFTSGQPWGTTVNHGGNILNDYLGDHATKDLSCDMNGDLIVDSADVALVTGG
jgi:hypothetical protein